MRWPAVKLLTVCALFACDAGGGGGGVSSGEDAGYDGEGDPPMEGFYEGEALRFRLTEDGDLSDLDVQFKCACDGVEEALDGRISEGTTLRPGTVELTPVVSHSAGLRIEGAFSDPTHVSGLYTFKCCTDVPWSAERVEEGEVPAGVCTGNPTDTPVPVGATDDGATLHWSQPSRCISITHEPALSDLVVRLAAATGAWADVECSPLCFNAPAPADAGPEAATDRRIHFQAPSADRPLPPGARAATAVRVRPFDGEITGATVILGPEVVADDGKNELLRQLGRALGYDQAPEGVESVLSAGGDAEGLSSADERALCAMYGEPPYCRD